LRQKIGTGKNGKGAADHQRLCGRSQGNPGARAMSRIRYTVISADVPLLLRQIEKNHVILYTAACVDELTVTLQINRRDQIKLESVLEKNPASHLREVMIKRNHRGALTMYYEQAQNLQTLPDMTEGSMIPALTEAIRNVNDIEVIDIIIGLLRLSNQINFVDKNPFGLRSACWDSLKNMASVHYDEVKTVLTKEKSEASGNHLLSCIDLLQQIDEINQHNIDKQRKKRCYFSLI
jgi:hypothetical protein